MTNTTTKRLVAAFTLAAVVAGFPAIYAAARTGASSGGWSGRMMGGCDEMMNRGSADSGKGSGSMGNRPANHGMLGGRMMGSAMMGDRPADHGMMGGGMMGGDEPPNQQWRR